MQKKLIALAIAGLSSAAFAQSNVTISGQMKVHFDSVSAGGCATPACVNLNSRTRVSDNNSNIRFSGEESLGGGNAAFFQIESAIGTDNNTGTASAAAAGNVATIGTRNTAVGLKGSWGMALMGKWDAHYNSMAAIDGAGLVDGLPLAANSLNIFHTVNGWAGMGGRLNNVVAYATPNFSGFSALVAYTTSPLTGAESTAATVAATNGGRKDKGILINPKYQNGPIAVSYSYLNAKNNSLTAAQIAQTPVLGILTAGATNNIDVRSNRLGGAYTFPMGLKVGLMWDKSKVSINASNLVGAAGLYVERTAWALPITYTTGAHSLYFTYAKAADLKTNIVGGLPNTNAKQYTLAYSYALSKRTDLNVTWSSVSNDTAGQYDFWHPSSNVSGGTGLAVGQAGADPRMFAVGMRHAF